jgi:hypothetical protein
VSNQVEIIYSSGRNSKETGEIIRILPRKSARGIRPLGDEASPGDEASRGNEASRGDSSPQGMKHL